MSADESARPHPLTFTLPGWRVTVEPVPGSDPPPAVDHAELNGTPARRGGRKPSGCTEAVWELLKLRGRLAPADVDRLLNAGEPRYGKSTIQDALTRLVAAGLAVNVGGRYEPAENV